MSSKSAVWRVTVKWGNADSTKKQRNKMTGQQQISTEGNDMANEFFKFGAEEDGAVMTVRSAKNAYETKQRIHAAL